MAKTPVWQRKAGQSESGGLNEAGRRSLKAEGHDIKRPQPEGGPRKKSFCARMEGAKAKLTSSETANDPDSRINKSLRKWKCADGGAVDERPHEFVQEQLRSGEPQVAQYNPEAGMETAKEAGRMLAGVTTPGAIADAAGYLGGPSALQNVREGNYGTAALQLAGAVPGIGPFAKAARMAEEARGVEDIYRAVQKAADISEKLRLERAKELGFNISSPYYHATRYDFNEFVPSKWRGATYLADTPEGAMRGWGAGGAEHPALGGPTGSGKLSGPNIMPVYIKGKVWGKDPMPEEWFPEKLTYGEWRDIVEGKNKLNIEGFTPEELGVLNWKRQVGFERSHENGRQFDTYVPDLPEEEYKNFPAEREREMPLRRDRIPIGEAHGWEGTEGPEGKKYRDFFTKIGYPSWVVNDEAGRSIAVSDPKNIRSIFATFDPRMSEGTDIRYSDGGSVDPYDSVQQAAKGGPIWDKPRPKNLGKPEPLSSKEKAIAKAAAKAAGRPYPNLIDNMRAARADGGELIDPYDAVQNAANTDGKPPYGGDLEQNQKISGISPAPNDYLYLAKPSSQPIENAKQLEIGNLQRQITPSFAENVISKSHEQAAAIADKSPNIVASDQMITPQLMESELSRSGRREPLDVNQNIATSSAYGTSTVTDPEGRTGHPVFVAGTTPTGQNVPLNSGQQAVMAAHLARIYKNYNPSGDYNAITNYFPKTQSELTPEGKSAITIGINTGYKERPESFPHELGHAVADYQTRFDNPLEGASPEALAQFRNMVRLRQDVDYKNRPDLKEYVNRPQEQWAEGFRGYITDPKMFKQTYPDAARFMRGIINTDPRINKLLNLSRNNEIQGIQSAANGGEVEGDVQFAPDDPYAKVQQAANLPMMARNDFAMRMPEPEVRYDTGPQPGEAELKAYDPTIKERIYQGIAGTEERPSPERAQFARGISQMAEFAPVLGNVMAGQEAQRRGDTKGMLMAALPVPGMATEARMAKSAIEAAMESRAARIAGPAWEKMTPEQKIKFMNYPDKELGGIPMSQADPQELLRQERAFEQGYTGPWYHGTARIDRLLEGKGLNPKRATSGPMPYFTDNPEIASNYAKGKEDTSLAAIDTGEIANYFTVHPKSLGWSGRTEIPVERTWHFLPNDVKQDILSKAKRIGYENPSEATGPLTLHPEGVEATLSPSHYDWVLKHEAKGNPLAALREMWHDSGELVGREHELENVFRLAGYPHPISQKNAPWTEAKGILPAMLRMERPLNTESVDEINEKVIPALEQAFKNDRSRTKAYGADQWDKNLRFTPKQWVAQLKHDMATKDNSYVWTSIPDKITKVLKELGYDGIIDTGGKSGGGEHRVAIPFGPHQVRSKFAKFDPKHLGSPDLLKSEGGEVVNNADPYDNIQLAAKISPRARRASK